MLVLAPGGKSFQLLFRGHNIVLNDKNRYRLQVLKSNLDRLKLKANILNADFTEFDSKQKYDVIILDTPCSAIGTIRKNPEIFFKNKGPDFSELISLQENMLRKASTLLNKDGFIIYMACSFLKIETVDQINKFLKDNNDFTLSNFKLLKHNVNYSKLVKSNYMLTLPDMILDFTIDGYFSANLKKIK